MAAGSLMCLLGSIPVICSRESETWGEAGTDRKQDQDLGMCCCH